MKKLSTTIVVLIGILAILAFLSAQLSRAQFDTLAPEQGGTGTGTAPTTNQILLGNASGMYDVTSTIPSGGIVAPGSDTQVIFNDAGSFGADALFTYNSSTKTFSIATGSVSSSITFWNPNISTSSWNVSYNTSTGGVSPRSNLLFDCRGTSVVAVLTCQITFQASDDDGTPATGSSTLQFTESGATTLATRGTINLTSQSTVGITASGTITLNPGAASQIILSTSTSINDFGRSYYGTGDDGYISYNGTNLIIDPEEVGTGALVIGDGEAGRDYLMTFDGEDNDGRFRWDEDNNYFWTDDMFRFADFSTGYGSIAIGTSPSADIGINLNKILTDVTGYGGDFQAHNRQTSTSTTYTAVGVRTQANIGTGVTTRGSATGGQFSARLNGWLGGSVVTAGEILGGRFAADTSGEVDNFTYPNFTGGRFILQIGPATDNGTVTAGYAIDTQINLPAASSTYTNARFINLNAMSGYGAGSSNTNFDAIYIGDMTNVSTTEANPRIFTIEPQDGAFKGGNKFNMVWEGNDFDEGHIVLNDAHIWGASSSLRIKTGSSPTSSVDYTFEISTSTVSASGTLKLSNGYINSTGTIPTLSACGTSPSIVGTNSWGTITEGSIATGCTMTFAAPKWVNPPACVVTSESALAFTYTVTSSTLAITNVGALSDTKVDFHCGGLD